MDLEWQHVAALAVNSSDEAHSYEVQLYNHNDWHTLPTEDTTISFYGMGAVIKNLPPTVHWLFGNELDYYPLRVRKVGPNGASDWIPVHRTPITGPEDWEGVAEPANFVATGTPTINGTAALGETLTADVSGIADDNGLERVWFYYQWTRDDGTGSTDIEGATDPFYTLTEDDNDASIGVQVSFVDRHGFSESLTSLPTDTVQSAPTVNTPATGAPAIDGVAQVGETLTANTSSIEDEDDLDNATFTYQWLADDADIEGATEATYTLTDADEGKVISIRVSFTDDAGNDETLTRAATETVQSAPTVNTPATGAPAISGTAQVGETLTADTSSIEDEDGLDNATFAYQWLADDADIEGATDDSYTLTEVDEGMSINVRVSFTDDAGNDETLTSAATGLVAGAGPTEPPDKPGSLTASEISHDSVTLTWDDPQDDTITGYVILRRDKDIHEEGTFETVEANTGTAETTYTDTSVQPERRYVYRIKAINADGESEISSWVRAYTPADPSVQPPARPGSLTASEISHDSVTLTLG